MSEIVIPYFSGSGHTKRLAEAVLLGVASVNPSVSLIDVMQMDDNHWVMLENAGGIVFGSPTYVGGVAGEFKLFLDETASRGFWPKEKLVDKMAAGFTVATYPSGDKLSTLMQLSLYAAQHGMVWVNHSGLGAKHSKSSDDNNVCGSWLGLMATSIEDKSKLISDGDILYAQQFGVRFAKAVARWG